MKSLLLTAACMFALVACDKPASIESKVDDPAKNTSTTNGTTTAATPTVAPAPMPVAVDDSILSTPADFEESAEKAITAKTYKAELATLETDLAKD